MFNPPHKNTPWNVCPINEANAAPSCATYLICQYVTCHAKPNSREPSLSHPKLHGLQIYPIGYIRRPHCRFNNFQPSGLRLRVSMNYFRNTKSGSRYARRTKRWHITQNPIVIDGLRTGHIEISASFHLSVVNEVTVLAYEVTEEEFKTQR